MEDLHLTPDILSYGLAADTPMASVHYRSGAVAQLGNVIRPADAQEPPVVSFAEAEEHASYVVIMTDPDAPTRNDPRFREWWHWIVVNIPGPALRKGDLSQGKEHWVYVPPGPPEGTGLHRYVLFVYKQKSKKQPFEGAKGFTAAGRGKQHVEDFAKKHGLGHPVAVAAFQAEFDQSVPELYKRLG